MKFSIISLLYSIDHNSYKVVEGPSSLGKARLVRGTRNTVDDKGERTEKRRKTRGGGREKVERRRMVPKQMAVRTATVAHGVEAASKTCATKQRGNYVGAITKMLRQRLHGEKSLPLAVVERKLKEESAGSLGTGT